MMAFEYVERVCANSSMSIGDGVWSVDCGVWGGECGGKHIMKHIMKKHCQNGEA